MPTVSLTVLGSGDAFSSGGRFNSGYVLDVDGWRALLDAGPTTLVALGRAGIAPDTLDAVFITHLHGDHYAGLPFLLLDALVAHPRQRALDIFGPPELEAQTYAALDLFYPTIGERVRSTVAPNFSPLRPGDRIEIPISVSSLSERSEMGLHAGSADPRIPGSPCLLTVFEVPHTPSLTCLAFRFEAAGRVVAYSGDTAWSPELPRLAAGAGLFVCESTLRNAPTPTHLAYRELLEHRAEFDARRILLTHLGPEMLDATVESPFELAEDGTVVSLQ